MNRIRYFGMMLFIVFLTAWISGWSAANGQVSSLSDTAKRFIGTWRLVSITATGQTDPNRGSHPIGLIYYDGTGHMAVQIMPDRLRPKYADAEPTPDEAKAAITGYTAYFGTYTIDERAHTVTHHRLGNINPEALGDFVRRYELASSDRLILRPLESTNELTWERIK
jgi:hypothetical protein